VFLRKKREKRDPSTEFLSEPTVDNSNVLLRKKLYLPKYLVEAFLNKVDPLKQYQLLKALSNSDLLDSTKAKSTNRCARALIASAQLVQTSYDQADPTNKKTVYMSRKQDKLPIVIDSGALYSVTPNLADFVGPIEKCSTSELNGLNHTIKVIGQGTVEWKIQDLFGTVRSIKTMAFYVPDGKYSPILPASVFHQKQESIPFYGSFQDYADS
jgi:hypothetical protein